MSNAKERLVTAQWVMERQLAWIAAAEIKVGVVVAIDTALLGGLAAAYAGTQVHSSWAVMMSVFCTCAASTGIFCAAMAVLPRLKGPQTSLLFFGKIVELSAVEYAHRFSQTGDAELLHDWATQVHRNAEIACAKHIWVRSATLWSFISAPAWVVALCTLVKY